MAERRRHRSPAGRTFAQLPCFAIRFSDANGTAQTCSFQFSQPDFRAHPLSCQRNAAWILFYLGYPARHADRSTDRLACAQLRGGAGRKHGLFRRWESLFLTDLISKVIIGEADWVSTDRAAIRRALILKATALTLVGLVFVGLGVAWLTSFKHNRDLISQNEQAYQEY